MVWYGTIWSTDCDMVWWYHSSFESLATTMVCGGVVCMSYSNAGCCPPQVVVEWWQCNLPWYCSVAGTYHSIYSTNHTYHHTPPYAHVVLFIRNLHFFHFQLFRFIFILILESISYHFLLTRALSVCVASGLFFSTRSLFASRCCVPNSPKGHVRFWTFPL